LPEEQIHHIEQTVMAYLDRIGKCIFPIPKALIHQG
jgi:hypothetical protein